MFIGFDPETHLFRLGLTSGFGFKGLTFFSEKIDGKDKVL